MANIANCYYLYDNTKFDSTDDLYLGVLSNMESRQSILKGVDVTNTGVDLTQTLYEKLMASGTNLTNANIFDFEVKQPKNVTMSIKDTNSTSNKPVKVSFVFTSKQNPSFVIYGIRTGKTTQLFTSSGYSLNSKMIFKNKKDAAAYLNSSTFLAFYNTMDDATKVKVGAHVSVIQRNTIAEIESKANLFVLDPALGKYVNPETGETLDRVSNVINNNEVLEGEYLPAAVAIGTGLDNLNRDIMNNQFKSYKEYTTVEGVQVFNTESAFNTYVAEMQEFKRQLEERGEQVVTNNGNDIVLYDQETGIGGAVDLVTVDAQGKIRIYDYKSMRGDQLSESYAGKKEVKYDTSFDGNPTPRQKHTKQQSYYKALFEKMYNKPVESINIVHVEVNMYEPGDRSVIRAEIAATTKLTPIEINLGKVRPTVVKQSFNDFAANYQVTEEDRANAEGIINAPENSKRFKMQTAEGMARVKPEGGDEYSIQNQLTGEEIEVTYEELVAKLALAEAYGNYILQGVAEIEEGTVNRNEPIEIKLPESEEETEALLKTPIPDRDPETVKGKTGNSYVDNYFDGDRLNPDMIPSLIAQLLGESKRSSDIAVLRILAANPMAFANVPFFIDGTLTTKGAVRMNSLGQATNVAINPAMFKDEADARRVILEEMIHAVTINELRTNKEFGGRINKLREAAIDYFGREKFNAMLQDQEELTGLRRIKAQSSLSANQQARYDQIIGNPEFNDVFYRLSNVDEFLVGTLISSSFQTFLNSIDINDASMKKVKSMWNKILDVIAEFLNLKIGETNNSNPILKYALYDALSLVETAAEKIAKNPEMLDIVGRHRKTISEIEGMFNLRDEEGNLNRIANVQEVADFINHNVYNVAALANEDGTIRTFYKQTMMMNASMFIDDAPGDVVTSEERKNRKQDFQTRVKSYALNLKARERSIQASMRQNRYIEGMTEAESEEAAINTIELDKELEYVRNLLKNVTKKGEVNVNNLIKLKEQALGELENIREFMHKGMNSADIRYALETTKFWLNAKNMMFSKSDFADKAMLDEYNDIEAQALIVDEILVGKLNDWVMTNLVKKQTSHDGSLRTILKEMKDLGKISAEVADLSTINSPILQALGKHIRLKDVELSKKRADALDEFDAVIKGAANTLKSYGSPKDRYEIFRQMDEYGNKTMNMVSRFSRAYANERKVMNFVYSKDAKTKAKAYEAYKFMAKDTELFNLETLMPQNDEDLDSVAYEAEKARLIGIMGEQHYMQWSSDQSKKIQNYKKMKLGQELYCVRQFKLKTPADIAQSLDASKYMEIWEERNSPYNIMKHLNESRKSNPFSLKDGYGNFKYIVDIPKRTITDKAGTRDSGYYDSKFEIIERNQDLLTVYNKFQDVMKYVGGLIPYGNAERLATGSIPEFQKSMYEALASQPSGMFAAINESLVDMVRTERTDDYEKEVDIVTGKNKRTIKLGVQRSKQAIDKEVYTRQMKIFQKTGVSPTPSEKALIVSEVTNEMAGNMDFDLSRVFSMYLKLGIAYENKVESEEIMNLTQMMMGNQQEYERTNKGGLVEDKNSNSKNIVEYQVKKKEESFLQQKRVLENTISSLVYGDKRNIASTKKKIYTKAEAREKKMYEEQLDWIAAKAEAGEVSGPEAAVARKKIQGYIDGLGAYGDTEKFIDMPLKYTQYVGMGWNIVGGISNMTFGTASNFIEAAGDEFYNSSELMEAYGKVMHSVARNTLFNLHATKEALKIRTLMDTYDIMAESGKEYKDLIGDDVTERLKFMAAFNANQRTEYVNQAPLMIVMLQKAKFTYEGEEHSLYDGFGIDGKWNEEKFGAYPSELVGETVVKIKALIQRNHGNYNPLAPMLAKRTGMGRLLLQFRGWMIEGYKVRLGEREGRPDYILGSEVKGRYWSIIDAYKAQPTLTVTKAMMLQIMRNFVPFRSALGLNGSPIDSFLNDGKIKKVDLANMKRLAYEMNLLIGALIAGALMKYMVGELDDEDDVRTMGLNLLLNQATRLQTDMLMYANPLEAMKVIQDPVPSMRILTSFVKITNALSDTIIDGEPEFENGINEGRNKIITRILEAVPFGRASASVISNTQQAY